MYGDCGRYDGRSHGARGRHLGKSCQDGEMDDVRSHLVLGPRIEKDGAGLVARTQAEALIEVGGHAISYRFPDAIRAASGSRRRRSMLQAPKAGPTARIMKARSQPKRSASGGMMRMVKRVRRKPRLVCSVRAVPM